MPNGPGAPPPKGDAVGPAVRRRATAVVVFVVGLSIYVGTISGNLSASHDSIAYLNQIDRGASLFHPHHLLYNYVSHWWLRALRALGVTSDSAFVVPLLNAVAGAAALAVLYFLLRARARASEAWALIGTALAAFSFGFWFYSVCVEVYMIPVLFLLASGYALTADRAGPPAYAVAGMLHGVAILFHQVHVLFVSFTVVCLLVDARRRRAETWRAAAAYGAAVVPVVAVPYALVMLSQGRLGSMSAAWLWLTAYAHRAEYWHGPSLSGAVKAGIGASHAVIGGHFLFALPGPADWLDATLAGKLLVDEHFLVREMSGGRAALLAALVMVLGPGLLWLALARAGSLGAAWRRHPRLFPATLAWVATYTAFFLFYEPSNLEFWIPQSVGVWLLIVMMWTGAPGAGRRLGEAVGAGAAAVLCAVNLFGSIVYLTDPRNDYQRTRAVAVGGIAGRGDLVVVGEGWIAEDFMARYTGADVMSVSGLRERSQDREDTATRLEAAVDRTLEAGGRVLFLEDAVAMREVGLSVALGALGGHRRWRGAAVREQTVGAVTLYLVEGDPRR